jgi:hypothetical protein
MISVGPVRQSCDWETRVTTYFLGSIFSANMFISEKFGLKPGDVAQVAEGSPRKCKASRSNPSTAEIFLLGI